MCVVEKNLTVALVAAYISAPSTTAGMEENVRAVTTVVLHSRHVEIIQTGSRTKLLIQVGNNGGKNKRFPRNEVDSQFSELYLLYL